jgi:hypothetical protein
MLVNMKLLTHKQIIFGAFFYNRELKHAVLVPTALHELVTVVSTLQLSAVSTLTLDKVNCRPDVEVAIAQLNPVDTAFHFTPAFPDSLQCVTVTCRYGRLYFILLLICTGFALSASSDFVLNCAGCIRLTSVTST